MPPSPKNNEYLQAQTERASRVLDWFVSNLNTYIGATGLDDKRFVLMADNLSSDLAEIAKNVEGLPPSKSLYDQLRFAKQMFNKMADCAKQAIGDGRTENERFAVRWIVHLRVVFLTLFNSHGKPDFESRTYSENTAHLVQFIEFLQTIFGSLKHISSEVRQMFEDQVTETLAALERLDIATIEKGRESC